MRRRPELTAELRVVEETSRLRVRQTLVDGRDESLVLAGLHEHDLELGALGKGRRNIEDQSPLRNPCLERLHRRRVAREPSVLSRLSPFGRASVPSVEDRGAEFFRTDDT
jgi:hypothetical protein